MGPSQHLEDRSVGKWELREADVVMNEELASALCAPGRSLKMQVEN